MKTGKGLAEYAISKIGTPYFFGAKMQVLTEQFALNMKKMYPKTVTSTYISKARNLGMFGKICVDCSGLIGSYRDKQIGSSQLYATAQKRIPIADIDKFPIGCVLWKSGHVAIYIGKEYGIHKCIEAKGLDWGVVKSDALSRGFSCGLVFADMEYEDATPVSGTHKEPNPYEAYKPTRVLRKGHQGNDVRWLQFELQEAGYDLECDGIFGSITEKYVKMAQTSMKIIVDGKVGQQTIKALTIN